MSFLKSLRRHLKPKAWKVGETRVHDNYGSVSHAKAVAQESNYIATKGIGLGKPKHKYRYKAKGKKVFVTYKGKVKNRKRRKR